MKVCFLGSSVTYGFASNGISFVEILSQRNNFEFIKEAISGTTLVDLDNQSYVSRLKRISKEEKIDLFIVQLSTNDASKNLSLNDIENAIEDIIKYIKNTFKCKIMFFSNPYYKNDNYYKMVELMKELSLKYNVYFIDMYSSQEFNDIDNYTKSIYMKDDIHPTLEGYSSWLVPFMEKYILEYINCYF